MTLYQAQKFCGCQIMIMYNSWRVSWYEPGIALEGCKIRTRRTSLVAGVVTTTGVKYLPHASQKLICSIETYYLSYLPNSWLNEITGMFFSLFAALSGDWMCFSYPLILLGLSVYEKSVVWGLLRLPRWSGIGPKRVELTRNGRKLPNEGLCGM
jgi:hypothetical protein